MVDITAGAEFCHGDTIFSIAQLVMRTLVVYRQGRSTIFRMPIYPMLNQCQ